MGLSALDAALSGLRVSQQSINTISNNVANVSTPGYTRKIMPQSSQAVQGLTIGVRAETIIRNVDINLTRDLWTQVSATGFYSIKENYLSRVEQFHGPPDQELSVAAEIAQLKDSFAALADSPGDAFLLSGAVDQAVDTADKINNLHDLLRTLRNDAQSEIETTINEINALLEQIADLNMQVSVNLNVGRSTALLEDQRDEAIRQLSELIEISFFTRGDGVMVVQTDEGAELAARTANPLFFDSNPVSASSFYPDTINGIFLTDPNEDVNAFDITTRPIGGRLGGLIELRDETFPKQTAQLDELAHKMALRFEAQGLRLFTDAAGNIPLDTAPDPTAGPPATSVAYVGFAGSMQVNEAILNDNTLMRTGTTGAAVSTGSNEVINRVLEYAFGSVEFQQAIGAIDMRTTLQAPPNNTLQNWLGIYSENRVAGSVDLTAYGSVADILAAGGDDAFGTVVPPGETDTFSITFDDPDFGTGPHVIEIDLRAVAAVGPTAADDLIAAITGDADWANAVADFNAAVSIGPNGELVFESRSDIDIAAFGAEPMSDLGFAFLGLNPGTREAEDPYFDIYVGNNPPTRITIDPNDNEFDLFAQLSAVPGLAVEDFTASADGFLRLRPGEDYTDPQYGGGLTIVGGPFAASSAGINGVVGPNTVADDVNISSALFGSFSLGPPLQNTSPITDVAYGSETDASLGPPIPTLPFRTTLLGPNLGVSTNIIGASGLIDFSQKMVNEHTQELLIVRNRNADEKSLRDVLQNQLLDESGVNIDEELGHLIVVQTAYSASARVITAVDEMFQELLNAVR